MSEQLKQELEADTDRLEAETVADSETIGEQEEKPTEGKLEAREDDESKEEYTVPMGKASLADIVSGIPAPTKEEVEAAEAENAKPVKQKAREKLEAEKKKATQKNFADPVITYLMKRCEEDQGLAEDVMQEGKTWNNSRVGKKFTTFKTEEDKQLYEERIEKKISAEERLPGDMYNMQTTMENKDNMIARLEKELSTVQSKKTKAIEALAKLRLEKQKIAGESKGNEVVRAWAEAVVKAREGENKDG